MRPDRHRAVERNDAPSDAQAGAVELRRCQESAGCVDAPLCLDDRKQGQRSAYSRSQIIRP